MKPLTSCAALLIVMGVIFGPPVGSILMAASALLLTIAIAVTLAPRVRAARRVVAQTESELAEITLRQLERSIPSHAEAVRLGEDAALRQWHEEHPESRPKRLPRDMPTTAIRHEVEQLFRKYQILGTHFSADDQDYADELIAAYGMAERREAAKKRLQKPVRSGGVISPVPVEQLLPWPAWPDPSPARRICQCFTCTRTGHFAIEHPGVGLELGDGWTDVTPMGSRERHWARIRPWGDQDAAEICHVRLDDGSYEWKGWGNQ